MEIVIIPRINVKNPSKFRSDNSKTIKVIFLGLTLKLSIFANTVKKAGSQNLSFIQEPISWNFQRTEKFQALQGQSCHKYIKCIKLFPWIFFDFWSWKNLTQKWQKKSFLILANKNDLQTFYSFWCCRWLDLKKKVSEWYFYQSDLVKNSK